MDLDIKKAFAKKTTWQDLDKEYLRGLIQQAKDEDLRGQGLIASTNYEGDITTQVADFKEQKGSAILVAKQDLCVAGLPLIQLVLEVYGGDVDFECLVKEGAGIKAGTIIGSFTGLTYQLLSAERILLNFLQYLSGIATNAALYMTVLGDSKTMLLDTRKTTPGMRCLEKYAVACAGAWNHRSGLFDRVMLKDNHLVASRKSIKELVADSKKNYPRVLVEVEVDKIEQIQAVLESDADAILLDNFSEKEIKQAVELINGRILVEASGGVNLVNLHEMGQLGLDFISCGGLTHQSQWVDIGLDWRA